MAQFTKGVSGNPAGRPTGSKGRATELRNRLYSRSDELIDAVINSAIGGDMTAAKLCLDRILPNLKPQEANIFICSSGDDIPLIDLSKPLVEQMDTNGLTAAEAKDLLDAIRIKNKLIEAETLEDRSVKDKEWKKKMGDFF